jgi:hypothetical protein
MDDSLHWAALIFLIAFSSISFANPGVGDDANHEQAAHSPATPTTIPVAPVMSHKPEKTKQKSRQLRLPKAQLFSRYGSSLPAGKKVK